MKGVFLLSRIILTLCVVFFTTCYAHAQKKKGKDKRNPHVIQGDQFFEISEYVKAAEEYKKAYDSDTTDHYALYRLGEAYRSYFNYVDAEKYYKIATRSAIKQFPLSRYWFAVMLKDNGNYLEAQEQFNRFRKEFRGSDLTSELYKAKAEQEAKGCLMALEELKKPQRNYEFVHLPTPVNSEKNDYSPVIIESDTMMTVASERPESKGEGRSGIGGNHADIFRFEKEAAEVWKELNNDDKFSDEVNTVGAESPGSFTKDKAKFYFTRCGNGENCAIYVAYYNFGKWQKPIRLNNNINMEGQWNGQPSVSPDGKVLFFVSLRPGGVGMHDIWYSTCNGDDKWSKAMNMGDKVNTIFSEYSPRYYAEEKTLFFSSNGREGFGGYDIYYFNEKQKDTIRNVGLPFNSSRDDQYFVLGEKKGYISSNRAGGIGNYDVYTFYIESKEALIAYINNDTIKKEVKSISVVGTLKHEDTKEPAADVPIVLADDKNNKLKTSTTNEKGDFRFDNLTTDKNYKVLLQEENARITKQVKYQVEKVEVKGSDKEATKTFFENIYFDFNQYDLKPEAIDVLNRLSDFCLKHPEVQVEMSANTDSYGSDEYNRVLSAKRGNAALDYLVKKGVDRTALVVNSEGEGKPVADNTSDIGRQLNRRVEFSILGGPGYTATVSTRTIDPGQRALYYVAKKYNMSVEDLQTYLLYEKTSVSEQQNLAASGTDYYIVQPKNTLYSIARLYGMSLDELREINGIKSVHEGVVIGQKLKVKPDSKVSSDEFYKVEEGDTLSGIASKFGLTAAELIQINHMEGYMLRKNMVLKIK